MTIHKAPDIKRVTPAVMLERLADLKKQDHDIETLSYMVGPDIELEWMHSIGVSSDDQLRELASPIPPMNLREIVANKQESLFLWTGLKDAMICSAYFQHHSVREADQLKILDFGCGCGRLTRFLQHEVLFDVHGTDVNHQLVQWCQEYLEDVKTEVNQANPPTQYKEGEFDFIYSVSIFTHLPETSALDWLEELARITADNGIVLLTTHGKPALDIIHHSTEHHVLFQMSSEDVEKIKQEFTEKGFVYKKLSNDVIDMASAGDDYGHSFTHESYVREYWARDKFVVVDFIPGGLRGWQDIVVLKRRPRKLDSSQSNDEIFPNSNGNSLFNSTFTPEVIEHSKKLAEELNVVVDIHEEDFIFKFIAEHSTFPTMEASIDYYFKDGEKSAIKLNSLIYELYARESSIRLLEFASGYGCVTRHFKNVMPTTEIVSCDIHEDAIEFIQKNIGSNAILSVPVPEDLMFSNKFDAVFALSFFSHMPKSTFSRWIIALVEQLNIGGFLIFTTHGRISVQHIPECEFDEEGFYFYAESEQKDLNASEYGTTVARPDYVINQINQLDNVKLKLNLEAAWWDHQDVYIVEKVR